MIVLTVRNKRGDFLGTYEAPMTPEKWQHLKTLPKLSKRFEIQLPNGYRLKYGEHKNVMKQNPNSFGQYVRAAYHRYFSGSPDDCE